jgi:hypothetical protein
VEIDGAFEFSIDNIGDKGDSEETEEPFAPGDEVVLVAGVVIQIGWEEQGAKKVVESGVEDDEKVDVEGPLLNHRETELPPPEVDDPEQKREGPAKMKKRGALASRMLDKARESAEKSGDAKANDDGDNNPDVWIKVGAGGVGNHELSRSLADDGPNISVHRSKCREG